ncbi:GDP-L-fucose synthase [compost metagenome]
MNDQRRRVLVAGSSGMVGSALVRLLRQDEAVELITVGRQELDLTRQGQVQAFLCDQKIDQVYVAAAKVGGIGANARQPADFILDNLQIECNLIGGAYSAGVQELVFLGSSCVYPRMAALPIKETALLSGTLESTNESYAIAKIAGMKLCEAISRQHGRRYRSLMPTNLYGPGDNFSLNDGHVLPALLRRFHEAAEASLEQVVVWGTGTPLREFMHVDDLAVACALTMGMRDEEWQAVTENSFNHLNVGSGSECSIRELVGYLVEVTGYRGEVLFDSSRPDGTPRKILDTSRLLSKGWRAKIGLREGILQTYDWYLKCLEARVPIRGVTAVYDR